jgi:hypothetical protein
VDLAGVSGRRVPKAKDTDHPRSAITDPIVEDWWTGLARHSGLPCCSLAPFKLTLGRLFGSWRTGTSILCANRVPDFQRYSYSSRRRSDLRPISRPFPSQPSNIRVVNLRCATSVPRRSRNARPRLSDILRIGHDLRTTNPFPKAALWVRYPRVGILDSARRCNCPVDFLFARYPVGAPENIIVASLMGMAH